MSRPWSCDSEELSVVVLDVSEPRIGRRALTGPAVLARLPLDNFIELLCQGEIFVGDALGRVIRQAHLDPRIGCRDVGMVPA